MQIQYKFLSDYEPTDEQLHLLMQEVAAEVKRKARKSDEKFLEELQQLVRATQKHWLSLNPDVK
ncbi:MAG: hypothetical protein NTW49_10065 [Bacteroidia bacterium]|nr:hypothetical protein [Bacteroidia bacterium]